MVAPRLFMNVILLSDERSHAHTQYDSLASSATNEVEFMRCDVVFVVASTSASNQGIYSVQQETSSSRRTPASKLRPKHDQKDHGRLVASTWKQ